MLKSGTTFIICSGLVVIYSVACSGPGKDTSRLKPETKMDSVSYLIGLDYGQGIRERGIKANPDMVYKGLVDGMNNSKGLFDDSVQNRLITEFQNELDLLQQQRFRDMLAKNLKDGRKFLDENRNLPGVTSLPTGLQYKILKIGSGDFPTPNDSVTIHYRAMYIDRTTFDMSYESGPAGVRLKHAIKGLSEGIQLMKPGAIYEFYIPPELAYGNKNYKELIPAGSTIIYSVELISIHK